MAKDEEHSASTGRPLVVTPKLSHDSADVLQRSVLSAIVYGLVGGFVGYWIGRAGDRGNRNLGRKFWMWVGGIGAGATAAYSSIKDAHREVLEAQRMLAFQHMDAPAPAEPIPKQKQPDEEHPTPRIQSSATAHDGILAAKKAPQLNA